MSSLCSVGCLEYLEEWLQHVQFLKRFSWISLNETPEWVDVDRTARLLIEKRIFQKDQHQELFHAYGYMKANMNEAQIADYKKRNVTVSERWVEFFKKMWLRKSQL